MVNVADASLNKFAPEGARGEFVPPSEEPVFILTASQLKDLMVRAIEEATEPILQEVRDLKDEMAKDRDDFKSFVITHKKFAIRTTNEIDRLFEALEKEPQPLQKDRGEILRALLAANGGKMLLKEARQKMHLNKPRFSELLATMEDHIETKPYHLNKSAKVLILKSST